MGWAFRLKGHMEPTTLLLAAAAGFAALWAWAKNRTDDYLPSPTPIPQPKPPLIIEGTVTDDDDFEIEFEPSQPNPLNPKTVPNPSGNPAGYNTSLYPNSEAVRVVFDSLGYKMQWVNQPPPAGAVLAFQKDYNEAVELGLLGATGSLDEDAVPGKNTLNAAEIIAYGYDGVTEGDPQRWYAWQEEFGLG